MEKILKPFIHFITYCVLYSVTFMAASALIALTFWTDYVQIIQHPAAIITLSITVLCHLCLTLAKSNI
jgi:MFS superfamily sulfate permease-like transporter